MSNASTLKGPFKSINLIKISLNESFINTAARFAPIPGTVILMSGGNLDCARYHIIAAKPWLSLSGRGNRMNLSVDNERHEINANPFDTLRMVLNHYDIDVKELYPDIVFPVLSGLFGYLSYDLKDNFERLPRTSLDDLGLPHVCLFAPSMILIHDKSENSTFLCIPNRRVSSGSFLDDSLSFFNEIISFNLPERGVYGGGAEGFRSNFIKTDYMRSIEKIKDYIASGHVYQVNMSQRFDMDFEGDPFSLFETLYTKNPAPFFAFIQAGDHKIVSTSPERFIQRNGSRVETRPIKGTRPRGTSPEEDEKLRKELMESRKDDAELSMIVDLLRNDLGKVCVGGSVRVAEHKRLEAYQNVYHLLSIVEGILDDKHDSVDLIAATFPGGSITGCPKIRSMEIIDELEPNRRHIYTGAIGYLSFHKTMDLSIAIRTATILNNKIIFSAGGGIVFDSDPEDEFDETLHKGRTLMDVFKGQEKKSGSKPWAWVNGTIKPLDRISIPITDPGFQYGYGFFETIRVDKGKPKYLEEHIQRFDKAMVHLFSQEPPDVAWDEIIHLVVRHNGLEQETAAVKIFATKGDRDVPPNNNLFIVTARPYTHRLNEKKESGLNILTYPEPRQTPLADHKTLNYLYYFLAGKWADSRDADEALILNPDGTISETNTGNIIVIKGNNVLTPSSPHVLPGIMQHVVLGLLEEWHYKIREAPLMPEDLFNADLVLITNSLMGSVPMLSLDGENMGEPSNLWRKINNSVL
jgi:para-aminobenzoate synthetase component 1